MHPHRGMLRSASVGFFSSVATSETVHRRQTRPKIRKRPEESIDRVAEKPIIPVHLSGFTPQSHLRLPSKALSRVEARSRGFFKLKRDLCLRWVTTVRVRLGGRVKRFPSLEQRVPGNPLLLGECCFRTPHANEAPSRNRQDRPQGRPSFPDVLPRGAADRPILVHAQGRRSRPPAKWHRSRPVAQSDRKDRGLSKHQIIRGPRAATQHKPDRQLLKANPAPLSRSDGKGFRRARTLPIEAAQYAFL